MSSDRHKPPQYRRHADATSRDEIAPECRACAPVDDADCLVATRQWIESVVVGLGLCPFARRVLTDERMQLVMLDCSDPETLLEAIAARCLELQQHATPETLLLVIPEGLDDFEQFLDMVALVEALFESLALTGELQLAHFHPAYLFADEARDAASHFSNRSPYPVLHVLREAHVSAVLEHYPDPQQIPARNIEQLMALGAAEMQRRLAACYVTASES